MIDQVSGEQRERQRRRRFWGLLGLLAVVAMPIGGIIGFSAGKQDLNFTQALDSLPPTLLGGMAVLYAAALIFASVRFVKLIDEVELADNLWASTAGFYFYGIAFPCWWLLARASWVPAPNGWLLFAATYIVAITAYTVRKWRAR